MEIPFVEPATPLGLHAHPICRPTNYFLWDYVKDIVYVPPLPQDINDLKDRIRRAVATTERHMMQMVWQQINYRLNVCTATHGAHTELS
jgi:hypothetical protein